VAGSGCFEHAISTLSDMISRLAAVSFTVAWVFSLLRLLLVEVGLAMVDQLEAVVAAKLAMIMMVSCWRSL
jgi:hypothetical protein